ncbi:NADH oxidase [Skermanella aerolata]|uniref:NADH oxidase n=2 Tax=Skermanella aerolata TaxID=393310 RepID=A0A512E1R1_9PROT|nr:methane monooxygenase [Skermanella aerolata KACC 11604]GEO42673.1 NADH oxidase [Skermanella aerolata]
MYRIETITEDSQSVVFDCRPNEDVISAAFRNNVILLSSCREGGCATCKAECLDGRYDLKKCSVQALPSDEEEAGMILLCRTFPQSDLVISLPYTHDRISFGQVQSNWTSEIMLCQQVSSNVVRLVLNCLDPISGTSVAMPFLPGQYVDIEIPGTPLRRSFSMASLPGMVDMEFFIRLLPDGRFSCHLMRKAAVGQRLSLRGPAGGFMLRDKGPPRPYCFVAGGTGLSPVLSMVRHLKTAGDRQPVLLLFGVTHRHELFCQDELRHLAEDMPNLSVDVSVMCPDGAWPGAGGTVVDLLRRHLAEADVKPEIYLCGPPAMIDRAVITALDSDIKKENIYFEKFFPS